MRKGMDRASAVRIPSSHPISEFSVPLCGRGNQQRIGSRLALVVIVAGMACSRTSLLASGTDGASARDATLDLVPSPAPDVRSADRLAVPIDAGLCGNGKLDPGEECDDGNTFEHCI